MSITFANVMRDLRPVGWWRLGDLEVGGNAKEEIHGNDGQYVGGTLGLPGAIVGDPNTAANFDSDAHQYVTVPANDLFSLVRGFDRFYVANEFGWGAAERGGGWELQVSTDPVYYRTEAGVAYIDQTSETGTWQVGLPVVLRDGNIQIQASWNADPAGDSIAPLAIVFRRQDESNHYKAWLRINLDNTVDLTIDKLVNNVTTTLGTAFNIGTYKADQWWALRVQMEGTALRARAWWTDDPDPNNKEPTYWSGPQAVCVTDSTFTTGTFSVRSSNSGSSSNPLVRFRRFWAQTLGLTVHVWVQLIRDKFEGETDANYIHWMGKGESHVFEANAFEWGFRLYSIESTDETRRGRVSAYMWNVEGDLGSGAFWQPDPASPDEWEHPLEVGTWHNFVAVFQAGDSLDTQAGVIIYKDAISSQPIPVSGALYSDPGHPIDPGNHGAPLRFATRDGNSFIYAALDEVAIFDRVLTLDEIVSLYQAAIAP